MNNYESGEDLTINVRVESLGGGFAPTFTDSTRALTLENTGGGGPISFPKDKNYTLQPVEVNIATVAPSTFFTRPHLKFLSKTISHIVYKK